MEIGGMIEKLKTGCDRQRFINLRRRVMAVPESDWHFFLEAYPSKAAALREIESQIGH
jgi:hypothetical protein